jgi:hypothetical protein
MSKSKWHIYDEQISKLIQLHDSDIKVAQKLLNTTESKKENYNIHTFCTYIGRKRNKGIKDALNSINVDYTTAKHLWHEIKDIEGKKIGNAFIKNPDFKESEVVELTETLETAIDNVLSKFKDSKIDFKQDILKSNNKALKVTTSDDHVGLEPNPNGLGLFKYEYNAKVYTESYIKVFNSILKEFATHGKFDLLLLDNLGDEQDGWNGLTTRGGHLLPQNMTNAEVFETCIDTKVQLIRNLVENNVSKKIILRKVTNDNHSGDFGHTINIAVQKIINLLYSSDIVEVETLTQFLEHRIYGKHCFILTHGKDAKQMFKGLPLQLNDKVINFINDYIRFYDIKSEFIHVEKGDLHQIGYNKCSTFDYRNFMSFAPPSSWVQHNFGDCYSGYSIQVIPKDNNEISHTDYFLNYKKLN